MHTYNYGNITEALASLKEEGFTIDFNINIEEFKINPHDYEIVHIFRYEGDSNPDDEATVYGIQSKTIKEKKGVFVSGFSANSDCEFSRYLKGLTIKGHKGL
ncbi:hypothetical protein [Flavobacterium luminosum]|nr:hypothetical protein [Flavobacterium sp. HXWNR70]